MIFFCPMVYTNRRLPRSSPSAPSHNGFSLPAARKNLAVPIYVQIADGLLDKIEAGELAPGFRLPPERELSERLKVKRQTVRRALRMLEAQGLLNRRGGGGGG